ncbi:hypothetical protein ACC696_38270, partial [Rhizobium ruizarguesonis]
LAHSNRHFSWGLDTFRHLPTLAVPFSHAFVPTLFTAKGKHPHPLLPPDKARQMPCRQGAEIPRLTNTSREYRMAAAIMSQSSGG